MVCGKTAGAADSKLLNQSFTSESNRNRPIRILIESQSFTGPYCIISIQMSPDMLCHLVNQSVIQHKLQLIGI